MSEELEGLRRLKWQILEEEEAKRRGLPHLYLHKHYSWSRRFFESKAKIIVLTSANQIGKSSVQIRRMIELATNLDLWPGMWPDLVRDKLIPSQFWYLYPTRDIATVEFEEKWRLYLPADKYKESARYGWDEEWVNGKIFAIHFKAGVTIYFKTYAQDLQHLQVATCAYVGCDEELPAELFDELSFRVAATDGYMSFVFTATRGQEFWKEVVELRTRLPEAEVIQVSMYDCQTFEDGSKSKWTNERIDQIKARCKSDAEIRRRVYGRFVVDSGRKYPTFDRSKNAIKSFVIPFDWQRYVGIDIGSGAGAHPAAISFIAVRPDFKRGVVYKFWRGDHIVTTAQDVLQKYLDMRGGDNIALASFDWASRDFGTIAARSGIPVARAEKSHAIGESVLGALFKNQMLYIIVSDESEKLISEFESLLETTPKNKAKDDGIDSLRYGSALIPWDWSDITIVPVLRSDSKLSPVDEARRNFVIEVDKRVEESVEEELDFWAEQIGG